MREDRGGGDNGDQRDWRRRREWRLKTATMMGTAQSIMKPTRLEAAAMMESGGGSGTDVHCRHAFIFTLTQDSVTSQLVGFFDFPGNLPILKHPFHLNALMNPNGLFHQFWFKVFCMACKSFHDGDCIKDCIVDLSKIFKYCPISFVCFYD
ncbi:hypothetical protein DM860_003939 [Cuscuta australis]|uniref:Uncharacterized protein n=1 Tax=Cuscuta australis TaxID=267555 RepID=A0A328CUV4_9ASTE|nr:hypothetical protein DM860_003939 [Cuscuta australis]